MGMVPDLDDVFSLKGVFKMAVGATMFVALGAVDLAIWHFMPGGVELFASVKEILLDNPLAHALSDMFSSLAVMIDGGAEQMAADMGVGFDPESGAMIPDLGL